MGTASQMEERSRGLYGALKSPVVYDTAMRLVGGPDVMEGWVNCFLDVHPGMRVLDVGSGTSEILRHLVDVDYFGLDPNPGYIQTATEQWGARGRFECGGIQDMVEIAGPFDRIIAVGVLHHVSDPVARKFFQLAKRLIHPQGRIVTLDPAFVPGQSIASRLLVSRDRGGHVRPMREYGRFADQAGLGSRVYFANHLLRIPYSHVTVVSRLSDDS